MKAYGKMEPATPLPMRVYGLFAKTVRWGMACALAAASHAQAPTPTPAVAAGNPEGESSEVSAGDTDGAADQGPTYPPAPSSLVAARLNGNLVRLNWNGLLNPIAKQTFKIFRSPGTSRPDEKGWELILPGGVGQTQWIDRNAPAGKKYRYAVVAAWKDSALDAPKGSEFSQACFAEINDTLGVIRASMSTPRPESPPLSGSATIGKFIPKVWSEENTPADPLTLSLPSTYANVDPPPENPDATIFDGLSGSGYDGVYGLKEDWLPRGIQMTLTADMTGIGVENSGIVKNYPELEINFGARTMLPEITKSDPDGSGNNIKYRIRMNGSFTLITGRFEGLPSQLETSPQSTGSSWVKGMDASSDPQWLMVRTAKKPGARVRLISVPEKMEKGVQIDLTSSNATPKSKTLIGNGKTRVQTTPIDLTASTATTDPAANDTLDASISGIIASINTVVYAPPKDPIRVAVCKVRLVDDQNQPVLDQAGHPISGKPPDALQLEKYLNKVYEPQVNITFKCEAIDTPLNYDVGTESENVLSPEKRGHHDHRFNWPTPTGPLGDTCIDDDAEMGVFEERASQMTDGAGAYTFVLFWIDQWTNRPLKQGDATAEIFAAGRVRSIGSKFSFMQNIANGSLRTPAHEIGHLLGLYHPWERANAANNYEAHLRKIPDTVFDRLMSYEGGTKLIKPEWTIIRSKIGN